MDLSVMEKKYIAMTLLEAICKLRYTWRSFKCQMMIAKRLIERLYLLNGCKTSLLRPHDLLIIARSQLVLSIHKIFAYQPVGPLIRPPSHAIRLSNRPSAHLVTGLVRRSTCPPADQFLTIRNGPNQFLIISTGLKQFLNIRTGRKRVLQACFVDT